MSLNVFGAASRMITAVNPCITADLRASDGSETLADGSVVPKFIAVRVRIQVQAASSEDLEHLANLNQSGDVRAVYIPAHIEGIDRAHQYGGDILVFDGDEWLVTHQPEQWGASQWCKVLVTRQIPSPSTCLSPV